MWKNFIFNARFNWLKEIFWLVSKICLTNKILITTVLLLKRNILTGVENEFEHGYWTKSLNSDSFTWRKEIFWLVSKTMSHTVLEQNLWTRTVLLVKRNIFDWYRKRCQTRFLNTIFELGQFYWWKEIFWLVSKTMSHTVLEQNLWTRAVLLAKRNITDWCRKLLLFEFVCGYGWTDQIRLVFTYSLSNQEFWIRTDLLEKAKGFYTTSA